MNWWERRGGGGHRGWLAGLRGAAGVPWVVGRAAWRGAGAVGGRPGCVARRGRRGGWPGCVARRGCRGWLARLPGTVGVL